MGRITCHTLIGQTPSHMLILGWQLGSAPPEVLVGGVRKEAISKRKKRGADMRRLTGQQECHTHYKRLYAKLWDVGRVL